MADWDGARYGEISELQQAMATETLAMLTLDGGERLLDVGCGDGWMTAQIANRLTSGSVLGLDPSPRMIEAARQQRDTVATFDIGDVLALTFDGEFDVVTSFNALHWVRDQDLAYRNIAAALAPEGRALVTFVCAGPRRSVESTAFELTRESPWAADFHGFAAPYVHPEPSAFDETVTAAGLRVNRTSVHDIAWDFGSREAFARWCAVGFGDWISRLGSDRAARFIDELVDRYTAVTGSPQVFAFYQLRASLIRPGQL